MVCLSADQFAENLPRQQWSRRETIEARGTKWNFDVENGLWNTWTNSGITSTCTLRQKSTHLKFEFTATTEEAMWRPRRGW